MHGVIRARELQPSPRGHDHVRGRAPRLGGLVLPRSTRAGAGPGLHKHPYSETWIVRSGRARFTADGEEVEAGPGDIVVVGPEPGKFKNLGPDRLDVICIHASPRMIQEDLQG